MSEEQKPDFVYEAEAAKLRAEADHFVAQTKRELEEAKKQAAVATAAALDLDQKQKAIAEVEADNAYHRIFRFSTDVNRTSVDACMRTIDVWRRIYPGQEITIVFTSPGGEVVAGMALWDYLQEVRDSGIFLTTVAQGMAASMAGILLQVGNRRILGRESYLLIHEIQAGMMGTFGDLQDRMKWLKKVQERILDIFARRASAAVGRDFKTMRRLFEKEWTRTDWWIDSAEALRLGLVDEVQ